VPKHGVTVFLTPSALAVATRSDLAVGNRSGRGAACRLGPKEAGLSALAEDNLLARRGASRSAQVEVKRWIATDHEAWTQTLCGRTTAAFTHLRANRDMVPFDLLRFQGFHSLRVAVVAGLLAAALSAQAGGAAGALSGMAQSLSDMLERDIEHDRQKELIQRQHDLEMQRIRQQYELQRQANEAAAAREREASQAAAARQREASERADRAARAKVEAAHPGWNQTVRAPEFRAWRDRQPASVQTVIKFSADPDQVILVLDLYERDRKLDVRPRAATPSARRLP
jgi:hypothetical protein